MVEWVFSIRFQRIWIEKEVATQRQARNQSIIERTLQHIDVLGIPMQQEQPVIPEDIPYGRTCFIVSCKIWKLIAFSKSFSRFSVTSLKKWSMAPFLKRWKREESKQAVLDELEAEGLPFDFIASELGKDLDPFDLICHIAFDAKPLTRRERAEKVKKRDGFTKYGPQAKAVTAGPVHLPLGEKMLLVDQVSAFAQ